MVITEAHIRGMINCKRASRADALKRINESIAFRIAYGLEESYLESASVVLR